MVVSVLNPKGGTGKTTLATNLGRALQSAGEVLLLDVDPQQSAQEWAERNPAEYPDVLGVQAGSLLQMLPKVTSRYDHVLIDGAALMEGRLLSNAVKVAEAVLVPVQPSGLDIWGVADLVELIHARQALADGRPSAAFVVSRQVQGTRFATDVQGRLEQMGLPVFAARLTQRIDFAEAATVGLSVLDYRPRGKAAGEIRAVTQELLRLFNAHC